MSERSDGAKRALALMAEALRLLDADGGHATAASHLQLAHDLIKGGATREPDTGSATACEDELAMDRTAVRALGGTLSVLASVLGRAGVIPMRELGDILAIYATITSESDRPQGLLIACWASMLRDAADHCTKE
jgi:hypothetical protein